MTVSSFSTAYYLHRHIRRVAQGTSYFATPKIQSQIRVTITGILQGVLYLLYATFSYFETFTNTLSLHFVICSRISFTVSTLYIASTTVNLGIGQTLFRQRIADVWKALKALLACLSNSVTFSFWLNFFYYTQIVPAQRTLFICIKKNIKSLIYCFWLAYLIVCLCVMVMTSYSTVVYLCRHMRRMVTNGQSLSCPQFRSQVRVAVISILQGVLYYVEPGSWSGCIQAESSRHLAQSSSVLQSTAV
ncbi:uncharacterized protein LOC115026516 [Cottoperca gobio]|uniref:Uncharacterized protein LOC115026516 n=1 Tax=Cottoperca gobio TaxID=56716 RepID=A0A6J2RWD1_COTGO|nr:uncharacterized protein LOC115026516 [Cottoperca gobio]